MQSEPISKIIDGREWSLALLPASAGLKLGSRLVKLLGPAVAEAVKSQSGSAADLLNTDTNKLGGVFETLSQRLGEPEAADLVKELVTSGVLCDGKEVNAATFDLLFQGEYLLLLKVAAWVVEANYKLPFSSLLASRAAAAAATKPKTTESPDAPPNSESAH